MHQFDIERIKRDLPINALIDSYNLGGDLKKRGAKLTGACPIHGGKNKTFADNYYLSIRLTGIYFLLACYKFRNSS